MSADRALCEHSHQMQIQRWLRYRLLVEGGAVETEQIALSPYIESRSCHIDHTSSLTERSE